MPGDEALYGEEYGIRDLYPTDEEKHAELISWVNQAFTAADTHRQPYYDRWVRYYKLYRSYIQRKKNDWRSKVFYPICFYVIETVAPRLVASLPKMVVYPVSEDDVLPARKMEELLHWATQNSDLYVELVKAVKSSLKYGTGIMKVFWDKRTAIGRRPQPIMAPIQPEMGQPAIDPDTGEEMRDLAGQVMTEPVESPLGEEQIGVEYVPQEYVVYEGPAAEAVDIFNFWVAPEAEDIQPARYVIHRTYREWSYIEKKAKEGVYRLPPHLSPSDIITDADQPWKDRAGEIELGSGTSDSTRKAVEILEFWTSDNLVITVANKKAILRVTENPFDHGLKPFIRVPDILAEHEFWGIGEIEPLEGLQDQINALVNQRLDNVRLALNQMFAVNIREIQDLRDLEIRPGGVVRVTGDLPAREVIQPLDMGDVTGSAFSEAEYSERTVEKVSGVTSYQLGLDSPSLNRTATGASLLNEAATNRFGLKTRLMELIGLKPLARMFGSLIQQFVDTEKVIRILGPSGQVLFDHFTPESIQGSLDYDIEAASSTQTETVRKDQALTLFQTVGPLFPQALPALMEDVLREFGVKDMTRYLQLPPPTGAGMAPVGGNGQLPPELAGLNQALQGGGQPYAEQPTQFGG